MLGYTRRRGARAVAWDLAGAPALQERKDFMSIGIGNGWSSRIAVLALWSALGLGLTGCGCKSESKPYNVTVSLDPSFAGKPVIEVHLVGINDSEDRYWNQYSMTRYWSSDDKLRQTAPRHVMQFGPNKPDSQTLSADHALWNTWLSRGATKLYVLAFLPEKFDDAPGDTDPRRRILPLDRCKWPQADKQQIKVKLLPSNVEVETPPGPAKK